MRYRGLVVQTSIRTGHQEAEMYSFRSQHSG